MLVKLDTYRLHTAQLYQIWRKLEERKKKNTSKSFAYKLQYSQVPIKRVGWIFYVNFIKNRAK